MTPKMYINSITNNLGSKVTDKTLDEYTKARIALKIATRNIQIQSLEAKKGIDNQVKLMKAKGELNFYKECKNYYENIRPRT